MKNYVQDHFDHAPFLYGMVREYARCVDGTTLSIQASQGHYCSPRDDVGPYTSVEVYYVTSPTGKFIRATSMGNDHENPYPYVDVSIVNKFIHRHGGLA